MSSALAAGSGPVQQTVIEPRAGWQLIDWKELRQYRDLFFFLVWRDIKVRYSQTVLGAGWAVAISPAMAS